MYILIPVIFLCTLSISPLTVCINVNAKIKDKKIELEALPEMKNNIILKILKVIPVYKHKLFKEKKNKKKNKKRGFGIKIAKVVVKTLKIDELYLNLGINSYSYILNSYLNALINTSICMYVNVNSKKFNFSKLYYQIYTSECPFAINLNAKISSNILKIIYMYFKSRHNKKREKNNNLNNFKEKMNKRNISCTY